MALTASRLSASCIAVALAVMVAIVLLTGYGYESYPDCPLEFSGIGNIHVSQLVVVSYCVSWM